MCPVMDWQHQIQCVFPLCVQCSHERIHHNPDQDKAATKDERY